MIPFKIRLELDSEHVRNPTVVLRRNGFEIRESHTIAILFNNFLDTSFPALRLRIT